MNCNLFEALCPEEPVGLEHVTRPWSNTTPAAVERGKEPQWKIDICMNCTRDDCTSSDSCDLLGERRGYQRRSTPPRKLTRKEPKGYDGAVIGRLLARGMSMAKIARELGVNRYWAEVWVSWYRYGGNEQEGTT